MCQGAPRVLGNHPHPRARSCRVEHSITLRNCSSVRASESVIHSEDSQEVACVRASTFSQVRFACVCCRTCQTYPLPTCGRLRGSPPTKQVAQRVPPPGRAEVSVDEFVRGAIRLKGQARSQDVVAIMHDCNKMIKKLQGLEEGAASGGGGVERTLFRPSARSTDRS